MSNAINHTSVPLILSIYIHIDCRRYILIEQRSILHYFHRWLCVLWSRLPDLS